MTSLRTLLRQLDFPREDPPLIMAEMLAQLPATLHDEAVAMLGEPLPLEWRRILAIALGRCRVAAAFSALSQLRLAASPRLRAAAWIALRELGDPATGALVPEGLQDPSTDVRKAACLCAGRLGTPATIPHLERLLADDGDWWLRYEAARALHKLGPPGRAALKRWAEAAGPEDAGRQVLIEAKELPDAS